MQFLYVSQKIFSNKFDLFWTTTLFLWLLNVNFHIDVTFEMRTAVQSNAFIPLMITHKIRSRSENGRGEARGQDSGETERERGREYEGR